MFKVIVIALCLISSIASAEINVTRLDEGGIREWETETFFGETHYELDTEGDMAILKAISDKSASALFLEKKIDLESTPYLNWSWLLKEKLPELNELTKKGDDHAARIYVVIKDGPFIWNTKSINYVWSGSQNTNEVWNNPFAGENVKMMSIQGKNSKLNHWYREKRNLYQDLIRLFGDKGSQEANLEAYRYIDAIALMTDTDNSKNTAKAYYGDIVFTSK